MADLFGLVGAGGAAAGFADAMQKGELLQMQRQQREAQQLAQKRQGIYRMLEMARNDLKDKTPEQAKLLANGWMSGLEQQIGRPLSPTFKKYMTGDPQDALNAVSTGALAIPGFAERFDEIITQEELFLGLFSPMLSAHNERLAAMRVQGRVGEEAPPIRDPDFQLNAPASMEMGAPGATPQTAPVDLSLPQGRPLEEEPAQRPSVTGLPTNKNVIVSKFEQRRGAVVQKLDNINQQLATGGLTGAQGARFMDMATKELGVLNNLVKQEDAELGRVLGVDPTTPAGASRIFAFKKEQGIEDARTKMVLSLYESAARSNMEAAQRVREWSIKEYGYDPGTPGRVERSVGTAGPSIALEMGAPAGEFAPPPPAGFRPKGALQRGAEDTEAKAVATALAKDTTTILEDGQKAVQARDALRAASQLNPVSGPFVGPARDRLDAFAQLFGVNSKNQTESELFRMLMDRLVFAELGGKLGAGFSNADRDFVQGLLPTIKTNPQARRIALQFMQDALERRALIAQAARVHIANSPNRSLDSTFFDELSRFSEKNPLSFKYQGALKEPR